MTDLYIGGGRIPVVLNCSPHQTALELWEELTADAPPPPPDPKQEEFFRTRRELEPFVVGMLKRRYGISMTKVSTPEKENRYRDREQPGFRAEIDCETQMNTALADLLIERLPTQERLIAAIPFGTTINFEIKVLDRHSIKQWGDSDSGEMPNHIAAQPMWGLGVTRRTLAVVAPLFGYDELPLYPIVADEETIAWMRRAAVAFLAMVRDRIPPQPKANDLDDLRRFALHLKGVPVEVSDEIADAVDTIFHIREMRRALEKDLANAEHRVFDHVRRKWDIASDPTVEMPAENAVLRHGGKAIAVWRYQTQRDFDEKAFRAEEPERYERFVKPAPRRVFAKPPKGAR